jgi:hypothetical protein
MIMSENGSSEEVTREAVQALEQFPTESSLRLQNVINGGRPVNRKHSHNVDAACQAAALSVGVLPILIRLLKECRADDSSAILMKTLGTCIMDGPATEVEWGKSAHARPCYCLLWMPRFSFRCLCFHVPL